MISFHPDFKDFIRHDTKKSQNTLLIKMGALQGKTQDEIRETLRHGAASDKKLSEEDEGANE